MTQMANSKAPKHDFAPAWLKIPSSEGLKSSSKALDHGDKSRPRRDDYHGGFNRFGASEYMYGGPMQRQRSFDNYYDERRYSPQKFRHHSGDDDPFSPPYGYNYPYNGYNYDKFNNPYRGQPPVFHDSKYQHPNSRYGQMTGGFGPPGPPPPPPPPHYYDPYFYEYYANDPYYNNQYMRGMNGNGNPHKRYPSGDKEPKYHGKSDKEKEGKTQDSHKKPAENLEEEFPSLNGDAENGDGKTTKPVPSSGVWDKGPSAKLVNGTGASQSGEGHNGNATDGQSKDGSNRQQSNSIYKSLIPKQGTLVRKGAKDSNKTPTKDQNSNHAGPVKINNSSPFKLAAKDSNKEGNSQSPTPPIDILNTRLVTTPKNLADKKSDFLKTLREDDKSHSTKFDLTTKNTSEQAKPASEAHQNGAVLSRGAPLTNGLSDLTLDSEGDERILSSSLEAEQRLLLQMGWQEDDSEDFEITEDEKREFEKRSQQLKEQRNGFKKTLPAAWSPQHLSSFLLPLTTHDDDDTSSLSEDSGLE